MEVFFPTYGWVTFDPTPADGRLAASQMFGRLSLYMDAFQSLWEEWIINYDFVHQITLARQIEGSSRQFRTDSRSFFQQKYRSLTAWMEHATAWVLGRRTLALVLMALSALGLWGLLLRGTLSRWLRELRMRSRARRGVARPEDATLVYLRLLRILSRRGIQKPQIGRAHV